MNLRKCALLLLVAMFALANVAEAQSTKTKSKSKAKKSAKTAKAPVRGSEPPPFTPGPPSQSTAQTPQADEHKAEADVPRITVAELKEKLAKNAPVFIIDSRSQGSWDNSEIKIKGAVRIPADEVEARLGEIPRDREIVVYCT